MVTEFENLYKPIPVPSDIAAAKKPAETPQETIERVMRLREAYYELKSDMIEEVNAIERRLIGPAKDAQASLKPMKKVIKKREDKKLDYERYKSRADTLQQKSKRSERENTALSKHEADLARTTFEYEKADEHLRQTLPAIVNAVFALLPGLLGAQIEIQNTLLGNVYTSLHNFSQQYGFPSPPPEPEEIVGPWDAQFTPFRKELETSFKMLAGGKAILAPMRLPDPSGTVTGLGIRNRITGRRQSSQAPTPSPHDDRLKRTASTPVYSGVVTPPLDTSNKPKIGSISSTKPKIGSLTPNPSHATPFASVSPRLTPVGGDPSADYFSRPRIPSTASSTSLQSSYSTASSIAAKKKPPPPPPKKIGSFHAEYVTAMYDFEPQSEGDLGFREGDRIRVTKKTPSSQDWWEGELHGAKGSFPANYVR
jgi:amphiphysin